MPKHVVLFVLMALLAAANPRAQDRKPAPYPVMAPVDEYTIASREAEIALARTAAPPSISAAPTYSFSGGAAARARSRARK